jgi:hypothetical protein
MTRDPVATNPGLYSVVLENSEVRVLEYRDRPGDRTQPHEHPDSVMVVLSSFRRRLLDGDRTQDVELETGMTRWLAAQAHAGENIGNTETHVIFVELKRPSGSDLTGVALGPSESVSLSKRRWIGWGDIGANRRDRLSRET